MKHGTWIVLSVLAHVVFILIIFMSPRFFKDSTTENIPSVKVIDLVSMPPPPPKSSEPIKQIKSKATPNKSIPEPKVNPEPIPEVVDKQLVPPDSIPSKRDSLPTEIATSATGNSTLSNIISNNSHSGVDPSRIYNEKETDQKGIIVLSKPDPPYPPIAVEQEIEGIVDVIITINKTGSVDKIEIVNSPSKLLNNSVISTIKKWKFKPPTVMGIPVAVRVKNQILFSLSEK